MQIVVGLVSGNIIYSDVISENDVIREAGGNRSYQDICDEYEDFIVDNLCDLTKFTIEFDGEKRIFNPRNIEWVELHR